MATEKTTQHQLEQVARMITDEVRWLGLIGDGDRMALEKGSKVNGNPYRLYATGNTTNPLHLPNSGRLGLTRSEAYTALVFVLRTLEGLRWAKGEH